MKLAKLNVRSALVTEYLSDVTFVLGERHEELKAHKFFLMTASPLFLEIFSKQPDHDLKIEGISKETMTEICRYAYTEQIKLNNNNMLPLLYASSKLQMKFLMEKVTNFICKEGMNETTVFVILEANQKDKNMVINMKCFNYIEKNYQKCLKSSEFLLLPIETIRLLLQTCKLPSTAAKEAIALWSSQEENQEEDLDELIALVSLNEDVPEIAMPSPNTDSESLPSTHSRARSAGHGTHAGPRPNPKFNKPQSNKNFHGSNNSLHSAPQHRHQPKEFNQTQFNNSGPDLSGFYNSMVLRQQQQQRLTSGSLMNNIFFDGQIVRKNRQFSNLDLTIFNKPIAIYELHFTYDVRTTDKSFDIRISDVTNKMTDLFYDKVQTTEQRDKFFSYTLPRPCQLPAGSKIWISLQFDRSDNRLSFDTFVVGSYSASDRIGIRYGKRSAQHGQIISTIVFSDC